MPPPNESRRGTNKPIKSRCKPTGDVDFLGSPLASGGVSRCASASAPRHGSPSSVRRVVTDTAGRGPASSPRPVRCCGVPRLWMDTRAVQQGRDSPEVPRARSRENVHRQGEAGGTLCMKPWAPVKWNLFILTERHVVTEKARPAPLSPSPRPLSLLLCSAQRGPPLQPHSPICPQHPNPAFLPSSRLLTMSFHTNLQNSPSSRSQTSHWPDQGLPIRPGSHRPSVRPRGSPCLLSLLARF